MIRTGQLLLICLSVVDQRVMKNIIQSPTLHDTHGTVVTYLFTRSGHRVMKNIIVQIAQMIRTVEWALFVCAICTTPPPVDKENK